MSVPEIETVKNTAARASEAANEFVIRAAAAPNAREAADWSLAARNMAGALHSLLGALQRGPRP